MTRFRNRPEDAIQRAVLSTLRCAGRPMCSHSIATRQKDTPKPPVREDRENAEAVLDGEIPF
jgi:hypothetical protein